MNGAAPKRGRTFFSALLRRARDIAGLTAQSFWRGFLGFYHSDNLTYAASIAYYALLSLFPFFLLALTIIGRMAADPEDRADVLEFVLRYFPRQFEFITHQLAGFSTNTITISVNYAWGVEKQRSFWKHKLFSFVMLLVAGAILMLALLLVSASKMVGASWFAAVLARFPGLLVMRSLTIRNATTLLFVVVVGFVFYFVPNAKVRFRDVWIGAVVTGLLWKGALDAFSWYMGDMSRFTRVNGSIAAVVVFLAWVYVQAVILLYGVEFTAAYARLRRGRPEEVPAAPAPRT